MSASYSALELGLLEWKIKMCQDSVWSDSLTEIKELTPLLGDVDLALLPFADRIAGQFQKQFKQLLIRIEKRHRSISNDIGSRWWHLLETEKNAKIRHARYHEYLVDEANHIYREWQKEDRSSLRQLLAALFAGDKRLRGYYDIGDRFGAALDDTKRPLTKKDRDYILAGMKKLPVREQREIERRIFVPKMVDIVGLYRQIKKLGRFLQSHEDDLVAKPKWDGKTLSYRGQTEEIKIQDNSVIGIILGEAEKQQWADSFGIPKDMSIRKKRGVMKTAITQRMIANALSHFHREHKILELSLNGNRAIWGPPGTVKGTPRGIAKKKAAGRRRTTSA